jgi:hypothetical protein
MQGAPLKQRIHKPEFQFWYPHKLLRKILLRDTTAFSQILSEEAW